MCKVMEDMRNEVAEGMKIEIAQRLLDQGKLSIEDVADAADISLDRVRELAGKRGQTP